MDNQLRHLHRNGRAVNGLGEAASMLCALMERDTLSFMDVSHRTGISTQVLDRFVNEHAATLPTLRAIESAFCVQLPMPKIKARYTGAIHEHRDGGWVYVITQGMNECRNWRLGSREQVAAHMKLILRRLNQDFRP